MTWKHQRMLRRWRLRSGDAYLTWHWTNWTFGVWWGRLSTGASGGVDLGPLEFTVRKRVTRRPTA